MLIRSPDDLDSDYGDTQDANDIDSSSNMDNNMSADFDTASQMVGVDQRGLLHHRSPSVPPTSAVLLNNTAAASPYHHQQQQHQDHKRQQLQPHSGLSSLSANVSQHYPTANTSATLFQLPPRFADVSGSSAVGHTLSSPSAVSQCDFGVSGFDAVSGVSPSAIGLFPAVAVAAAAAAAINSGGNLQTVSPSSTIGMLASATGSMLYGTPGSSAFSPHHHLAQHHRLSL